MEPSDQDAASDDAMDSFLEKFQSQPYRGGFREDQWEEEFEKVPLFMKNVPSEIDPKENPDLACLQSIIFDEERSPEGNFRSALNDVMAARKLKPCHLKAIVRGALCHLELKHFAEAVNWCDEGLQIDAKEKKLLEMRAKADKLKRTEQRDTRKAKLKEKKEQNQNKALLQAVQARNIRLSEAACENEDSASEGPGDLFLNGLNSENPYGARLSLDDQGRLSWPVLFLYPEYAQSDFISAFHEDSRFIDHLMAVFGETPSWDLEQKYCPDNLEVYFEDEDGAELYQVPPKKTLLQVLQHPRYVVKSLTPAFLVCIGSSPFCKNYLQGRKVHQIK
ncbi:tetratricopeptide repeat protein 4 isoform X2 [Carlito syrichta]|uniref:Tetratricopeptide repeat protein 4 isoform X2 n=1 Tax=Carlito syrichta TaxID=1868482 RepID=A0A1U7UJI0_CARSF|nr:tetratricopeptide repeat protein 4 isoform X2 [Carlito syrichta]